MSEDDRQDDGERLLNEVARRLGPTASAEDFRSALARAVADAQASSNAYVTGGPDRRVGERRTQERRALGFQARRARDAELNRQRRVFLFTFLSRLPRPELLMWIDGLWLGNATEAQLAVAVDAAVYSHQIAAKPSRARRRGRPRDNRLLRGPLHLFDPHDPFVRVEWRMLTEALRTLSLARRQHRAPMNRTRRGTPRSLDIRNDCLRSPIGQRADKVGLFTEFFDNEFDGVMLTPAMLTPAEMAARLLHRELEEHFKQRAARFKADAAKAPTTDRRDLNNLWASRAEQCLKQLPTWRTLYDKLRSRRSKGPASI